MFIKTSFATSSTFPWFILNFHIIRRDAPPRGNWSRTLDVKIKESWKDKKMPSTRRDSNPWPPGWCRVMKWVSKEFILFRMTVKEWLTVCTKHMDYKGLNGCWIRFADPPLQVSGSTWLSHFYLYPAVGWPALHPLCYNPWPAPYKDSWGLTKTGNFTPQLLFSGK